MSDSRGEKWGPIAGIVFVVLFIVGVSLFNTPDSDEPLLKFKEFYDDSGNRAQVLIAAYLLILSGVFFLWFLASLRSRLLTVEGAPGRLTAIVFGGGLVFVAMLMAAAAAWAFIAGEISFGDVDNINPELMRIFPDLAFPLLLVAGAFAAIAMIDAASVLIVRTGVLPTWIGWFGFVAALGLLFAGFFLPLILLLLWVVFVSVAMFRQSSPAPAARQPGPAAP
jgi:hypothetical protein